MEKTIQIIALKFLEQKLGYSVARGGFGLFCVPQVKSSYSISVRTNTLGKNFYDIHNLKLIDSGLHKFFGVIFVFGL